MFRYGVSRRPDYDEIRDQVHLVILLHDRLHCAKWAVENLRFKVNVRPSPPLLSPDYLKSASEKKNNRWRSALSKLRNKGGLAAAAAASSAASASASSPVDGGAGAAGFASTLAARVARLPNELVLPPGPTPAPAPAPAPGETPVLPVGSSPTLAPLSAPTSGAPSPAPAEGGDPATAMPAGGTQLQAGTDGVNVVAA
eukprot:tig00020710_g13241.t1